MQDQFRGWRSSEGLSHTLANVDSRDGRPGLPALETKFSFPISRSSAPVLPIPEAIDRCHPMSDTSLMSTPRDDLIDSSRPLVVSFQMIGLVDSHPFPGKMIESVRSMVLDLIQE